VTLPGSRRRDRRPGPRRDLAPPAQTTMTIPRKFFAVLAVLAPLIVAVALAGVTGLASMKSEFDSVFTDNIHTGQVSTRLGADLSRAEELAFRLVTATAPAERRSLNATLDQSVVPAVDAGLVELRTLHAHDAPSERAPVARLVRIRSAT